MPQPKVKFFIIHRGLLSGCLAIESTSLEEAANHLAMECLSTSSKIEDYCVLTETQIPSDVLGNSNRLLNLFQERRRNLQPVITRREMEVLQELVRGASNKEIAGILNLSVRTIKFHVSSLLAKFHVHSRMDLMHKSKVLEFNKERIAS